MVETLRFTINTSLIINSKVFQIPREFIRILEENVIFFVIFTYNDNCYADDKINPHIICLLWFTNYLMIYRLNSEFPHSQQEASITLDTDYC